jgi:hypothetical protein
MSQLVFLTHISTLTAYVCFEKRTLFHDVLSDSIVKGVVNDVK